jgi:hypothetical protein
MDRLKTGWILDREQCGNLQDLEQFTSIVNVLNASPCGKNCLFNEIQCE